MERKIQFLSTLIASTLLLLVMSASAKIGTGIITADALRIREKPTTESDIMGLLQNSTTVTIEGQEEDWYVISFGGETGYIHSDYVFFTPLPTTELAAEVDPEVAEEAIAVLAQRYSRS